jgi:hypothetical protein
MMIYSPTRVLVFVLGFCLVSGCHHESRPRVKTLHAKQPVLSVTSVEQAAKLVQRFESELYGKLYGKGKPHPPLASAEEPFSVIETQESYVFEFRKPFGLSGGGYVKTFHVHRATGRVTKGAWQLGR